MKAPKKKNKTFKPFKKPKRPDTILKRAKRVIEDGEWTKGIEIEYDQDEDEINFCLLGALHLADGRGMSYDSGWMPSERFQWTERRGYRDLRDDDPLKIAIDAVVESISPQARAKQYHEPTQILTHVVTTYNDESHRRRDDVLKLLDRAIENLRS